MAMSIVRHLNMQGFSNEEIRDTILKFRNTYATPDLDKHPRMVIPETFFSGPTPLKKAVWALCSGQHVIFYGPKGTGKNTLCNTLSFMFQRPQYELSFTGQTTVADILGEKTMDVDDAGNNIVRFEKHQLLQAMEDTAGAFFVGDEINMAKSDVLATIHEIADFRAKIDIPGLGIIRAHKAFRFIGTMNYGYMGTKELNEAFGDRFAFIYVPPMDENLMAQQLIGFEPTLNPSIAQRLVKLFRDLDGKAQSGTISSRAVTVRGLYQTIGMVRVGAEPKLAMECCITDKAFDQFEKTQVNDVINTLFKAQEPWFVRPRTQQPIAQHTAQPSKLTEEIL